MILAHRLTGAADPLMPPVVSLYHCGKSKRRMDSDKGCHSDKDVCATFPQSQSWEYWWVCLCEKILGESLCSPIGAVEFQGRVQVADIKNCNSRCGQKVFAIFFS